VDCNEKIHVWAGGQYVDIMPLSKGIFDQHHGGINATFQKIKSQHG
jgi:hypothetical protein